jgi:hypothetical protein
MARKPPKEWIFRGTVKLSGVCFYVSAHTSQEALEMAMAGDCHAEFDCAETVDFEIDPKSGEENR